MEKLFHLKENNTTVRHGHERRQAGDDLGAYGGVVFFQMKELFH